MTDKEFLLRVLSDGQPHTLQDILRRSFHERGHGLTVHSRAADLRRDGHDINVAAGDRGGVYRLGPPGLGERDTFQGPSGGSTPAATPPAIGNDAGESRSPNPGQLALDAPPARKAPAWA